MNDTQKDVRSILNEIEKGLSSEDLKSTAEVTALLKGENAGEKPGPNRTDTLLEQLGENVAAVNEYYPVRFYREFHSSRPGIGKIITLFKKIVRKCLFFLIDPMAQEQEKFNSHATRAFNANTELLHTLRTQQEQMSRLLLRQETELKQKTDELYAGMKNTCEALTQITEQLRDHHEKVMYHEEAVAEQRRDYDATLVHFYWAKTKAEELDAHAQQMIDWTKQIEARTHQIYDELGYRLDKNVTDVYRAMLRQENKIKGAVLSDITEAVKGMPETKSNEQITALLEAAKNPVIKKNSEGKVSLSDQLNGKKAPDTTITEFTVEKEKLAELEDENIYTKINYFDFENHFRGSRTTIRQNQMRYIPYFKGKSNVLDIGCGRGEFLELLKENHISATGIEFFPEVVDFCNLKGLSVIEGDGIAYLTTLPDASIDGIFAGQVVEHLTTDQLLTLCYCAYHKLSAGGTIILETPNPTTLAIFANFFYVDPSHVKPVHPLTLRYFLETAGFSSIDVIYTEESRDGRKIIPLEGDGIENLEAFNESLQTLSDFVYGCQDYAIIATK